MRKTAAFNLEDGAIDNKTYLRLLNGFVFKKLYNKSNPCVIVEPGMSVNPNETMLNHRCKSP